MKSPIEFHGASTLQRWMVELVPAACRAKLHRIYEEPAEVNAAAAVVFERLREAGEDVVRQRQRLADLERPHSGTSPRQLHEARTALQLAEEERQRLQAQHDRLAARQQALLAVRQAVADFLDPRDPGQRPPAALAEAAPVESPRAAGEPHDAALARLREAIAAKQTEIAATETAVRPLAEALAAGRRDFATLVERGERGLDVRALFAADGGHLEFPEIPAYGRGGGTIATAIFAPDAPALLAALFPEEMWRLVERRIRAAAGGKDGIAAAERPRILARLRAELLRLERQEEAIIVQASASGLLIGRRPDADPRAVLGVEETDAAAPRAAAAGG
ncbi:MAG: hypothetical protein Kow00114_32950 [Kiloniellaceae bacterium]